MTLIRNTITRLLSVTESAKKSFDGLGLTADGTYLSFQRFSKIAGEDVYKAFDILTGQLDKFKADGDILREMFTMRNWATILPMLQEMNGHTATFVANYVEGESALEGYNTQLKSLGNEVLVLKQSFTSLMDGAITPFKDIMVLFISLLEKTIDSLKGLDEASKRFWSGLAVDITSTTVAISGLTFVAVGLFHLFKTVIAQETVKLLFNPITAGLMILGISMTTLYRHLKTLKKVEENRLENIKKLTKETKKFNKEIETSERLTKKYQEELKKLEDVEINKTWINANADIENVIKSTEEYANIMKNMDTAFKIDLDVKSPSQIREEKLAMERTYSRGGGSFRLKDTPTLDAEKEFNILKRKKEKLDELMPLYKKYDESEKKIIELMHTYYKTKEQEASYENAITDSRKLKLKIKELGGVENPNIKELEVQQKEYTKLVVEEVAKRKKAEEDYASKRATDLRTLQELFKTINTDINGVYAKDLTTMYEIDPAKYVEQYKAMYKEIFAYVDKYGAKIDDNKKIKTITDSHFQEMATGLKQFGDLYKKEITMIQDTLSVKELEKLYDIVDIKGGVTFDNRDKFSKLSTEEIKKAVTSYLDMGTATETAKNNLKKYVAGLEFSEEKAKEYAGALGILSTTTDKATGSNKKFSKSLSGLKDYDINKSLINPLERLKKDTELEKLTFDLGNVGERLSKIKEQILGVGEETGKITSKNISSKMKELLYKKDENGEFKEGELKTPTNGKWDKLTGKFKFSNKEDAIEWQKTLDTIGMTTKQYEEFVALTIKEKETQKEIKKIKKEQADRQAELNKNAKELVENYGKTDLEIAQDKLQALMGMREVSKEMLSTALDLFMTDGKISDEEWEKLQTMKNILDLTEKQTEEYKQQYDIINQINNSAKTSGSISGVNISSAVTPLTNIFSKGGAKDKYDKASDISLKNGNTKAEVKDATADKISAGADIVMGTIDSFKSVYSDINKAEIEKINQDIKNLELRKKLATTEKERNQLDLDILNKKKDALDKEADQEKMNNMTSVASMTAQGASTGATIGGPWGALAGGILGFGAGVLGIGKSDIEERKIDLDNELTTNKFLEKIANQTSFNNKLTEDLIRITESRGVSEGFKQALQSTTFTGAGDAIWSKQTRHHTMFRSSKHKDVVEEASVYISGIKTREDLIAQIEEDSSTIATLQAKKLSGETKAKNDALIVAYQNRKKQMEDFLKFDEEFKSELSSTAFAFSTVYETEDTGKELKSYVNIMDELNAENLKVITTWEEADTLFSTLVSDVGSGSTTIGNSIGNLMAEGIKKSFTSIKTDTNKLINSIQGDFLGLSDDLANGEDLIKKIQKGHSRTYYNEVNQHLKDAIKHTSQLKDEQIKVNEENQKFLDVWVLANGEISDVKDNLIGGLYDEMQGIFNAKSYEEGIDGIGSYLYNTISSKNIENILNDKFSQSIVDLNKSIFDTMGNISISSAQSLMNETRALAIQMDSSRQQMGVLKGIMSDNSGIEYKDSSRNIQYETGTTQSIINNTYITNTATINDSIGFSEDAGYAIATALMPYVEKVISER